MDPIKSQDQMLYLMSALLRDVQTLHNGVISPESLHADVRKVASRFAMEGSSFITKQLPRLGKALDKALSGNTRLDAPSLGFKPGEGVLPKLLGDLFRRVFSTDGMVLSEPCVSSIKSIRQVLYSFYKYKLPYDTETEQAVLTKFERTEEEVAIQSKKLAELADFLDAGGTISDRAYCSHPTVSLILRARLLLWKLFRHFDIHDIVPRHGPGSVSTGERVWNKWHFTTVSPRIAEVYPIDAYYFASLEHVADRLQSLFSMRIEENSARIILVPKDSRGPRLISCEPLEFQWIQQGLGRAIVKHVERNDLTAFNVHFTDQGPNQKGALLGSLTGKYATLDLNEASDRVSVGLVRLLFPEPLLSALLACRSLSTVLPDGRKLFLNKYAPMGSALCFPVLALVVWSLLTAAAPDADTREGILVYGDDVVVPSGFAAHATSALEAFGLKVNVDKSYSTGFFRESCGVDAYRGENVTPVRFRTVWSSHRCPETLASWTEYANSFYERQYFYTYELIAGELFNVYETIPERSQVGKTCPSLIEVPLRHRPKCRQNVDLQTREYLVWDSKPRKISLETDGWEMLHRFLTEKQFSPSLVIVDDDGAIRLTSAGVSRLGLSQGLANDSGRCAVWDRLDPLGPSDSFFRVCSYTRPRANKLVRRWQPERIA